MGLDADVIVDRDVDADVDGLAHLVHPAVVENIVAGDDEGVGVD